jgi:hypothetical protein
MVGFAIATGRAVVAHVPNRTNVPVMIQQAGFSARANLREGVIRLRPQHCNGSRAATEPKCQAPELLRTDAPEFAPDPPLQRVTDHAEQPSLTTAFRARPE